MTALRDKTIQFASRSPNLRVTVEAERRGVGPGRHAQFRGGRFKTSDPDVIAYLRGHRYFGSAWWEEA